MSDRASHIVSKIRLAGVAGSQVNVTVGTKGQLAAVVVRPSYSVTGPQDLFRGIRTARRDTPLVVGVSEARHAVGPVFTGN